MTRTTEDGERYQQCRNCGTDRTEVDYEPGNSVAAGIMGMGMTS